ncbi:hypothetical protein HF576_01770 [Microbacterium sp. CFH 90308]|uniref:Uncharacterized protein n=1 Tax=Microbacterium salsuginis TaxID=2722803 RepID=A0ABX1K7R5_9MICO|nr:hypothetical protein [Microbacterium sp. CFH 90308]NLP82567.1 hypothetical protein [Microbacterium sp. CFH 90308]
MERADLFTAQFDEVSDNGRRRFMVATELREREADGSIPARAWFNGEEFELDAEDDDGITIYVRQL